MISIKDTSVFQKLIGKKIKLFKSSSLHISEGEFSSLEMNLVVEYDRKSLIFNCDYKKGFFENENGDVFYDFNIDEDLRNNNFEKSVIYFKTTEITEIIVYGRQFNSIEFIKHKTLYNRIKNENKTDDLFLFKFDDMNEVIITFHPFLPSVAVVFSKRQIDKFWREYNNLYTQHYQIN